ncbi:MAG: hypothetical protein OHK0053_26730 [Microscillaceae bacterium]
MKKSLLLLLSLLLNFGVWSQSRNHYLAAGLQIGSIHYFGDLNPVAHWGSTNLSLSQPSLSLQLTAKFHPHFKARFGLMMGRLEGNDALSASPQDPSGIYRYARNLHFRNDLLEASLVGIYDFAQNRGRFYKRPFFTPYIFGGLALLHHNPKARVPDSYLGPEASAGTWVALQPLRTEGQGLPGQAAPYKRWQPVVPLGFGFRFKAADRIDIALEVGLRLTFTDYLDDVGGLYPNLAELNGDLARMMSDPSALPARENSVRDVAALEAAFGPAQPNPAAPSLQHYPGFGTKGEIRGGGAMDTYAVMGIQVQYVINTNRYRPYRRK